MRISDWSSDVCSSDLHLVELGELRDAVGRHAHRVLRGEELVAGAARQHLALARVQRRPGRVVVGRIVVPGLLDDAGGIDRHLALVGVQVLDAARGGGHGGSPFVRLFSLSANPRNRVAKLRTERLMAHDYCVNHENGALAWPPADSTAPTSSCLPNSSTAAA